MPFRYYENLSAANQRTYRKSNRIFTIDLPESPELGARVRELEQAHERANRKELQRTAQRLCNEITDVLGIERTDVLVLARRPRSRGGDELHGLYTREEGERPVIEVWMRTAQHKRVVAFRTFLRTLLHEACHHLDFTLFHLPETLHTEGFFRRESSLFRRLAPRRKPARPKPDARPKPGTRPKPDARPKPARPKPGARPKPDAKRKRRRRDQLELPW